MILVVQSSLCLVCRSFSCVGQCAVSLCFARCLCDLAAPTPQGNALLHSVHNTHVLADFPLLSPRAAFPTTCLGQDQSWHLALGVRSAGAVPLRSNEPEFKRGGRPQQSSLGADHLFHHNVSRAALDFDSSAPFFHSTEAVGKLLRCIVGRIVKSTA